MWADRVADAGAGRVVIELWYGDEPVETMHVYWHVDLTLEDEAMEMSLQFQ